ncbi:MAG TPA: helix-turn-helix transcriptional regulator [Candidatus Limnocylindrales bacterium]|nr:helix-turn-helix transcriptional regulator [Candidatus Limnocylindrales bacterium]
MPDTTLDLRDERLRHGLGALVKDARLLVGWTQRDLAARAHTSQATIWRIETALAARLDLLVVERVLAALGIRGTLGIDARHLADRRRQQDAVHARLTGFVAKRLVRHGWTVRTEVPLGDGAPRGWIDLLGYRPADRALLVEETKTDILDMGALQRGLAFYEREAWDAARQLGWRPTRSSVVVVALDTAAIARRLADNRELVTVAFPAPYSTLTNWLRSPEAPPPPGWTLVTADPAARGATWLRPGQGHRRGAPAYAHYAEAAARLRGR